MKDWNKNDEFLNNPFRVDGITERFYQKEGKRLHLDAVDPESGEMRPLFTAPESRHTLHDSKSYTKVFTDSGDLVKSLTPAATKLYLYIVVHLKVNFDLVYLNPPDVCTWAGFSAASFYRALDELLERRLIARKLKSSLEFWINPNIFYNGDRVRLFKRYKQNTLISKS